MGAARHLNGAGVIAQQRHAPLKELRITWMGVAIFRVRNITLNSDFKKQNLHRVIKEDSLHKDMCLVDCVT